MNILYKISVLFFLSSTHFITFSQETIREKNNVETINNQNYQIQKRVKPQNVESSENKKSVSVETENLGNPSVKAKSNLSANGTQKSYSPSSPAIMKTNVPSTKNSIVIINNPNIPIVDNLVNLIEEKKAVNESNNASLLNSSDYQTLNDLIQQEKTKFEDYIESNGIENCSVKEQNYYLSFLKEEGREQEYLDNIKKLK